MTSIHVFVSVLPAASIAASGFVTGLETGRLNGLGRFRGGPHDAR